MNACGHHHVGHIGILGVDKKGAEFYQVSLGGSSGRNASLGQILGPSFAQDDHARGDCQDHCRIRGATYRR